ncbi:MAG: hypothetical protein ACI4EW_09115 [Butyrivibrio sp.]
MNSLVNFFETEQEFYLDNISYNRIDKKGQTKEYSLNCIDTIKTNIYEDVLRLTICRTLKFEPEEIFELSVAYGAVLKFNKAGKELDWSKINVEEEFRENGQFVTANLMNRISLLIAEITSSFGQTPIILPPDFVKNNL